MSWENKIRRSVEESERIFSSKPVPEWSEPARWGPGVAVVAALAVIVVFGLVAVFIRSPDSAPAVSSTDATSTTMQATTTVVVSSGVEPLRLEGGVSLISVEMGRRNPESLYSCQLRLRQPALRSTRRRRPPRSMLMALRRTSSTSPARETFKIGDH